MTSSVSYVYAKAIQAFNFLADRTPASAKDFASSVSTIAYAALTSAPKYALSFVTSKVGKVAPKDAALSLGVYALFAAVHFRDPLMAKGKTFANVVAGYAQTAYAAAVNFVKPDAVVVAQKAVADAKAAEAKLPADASVEAKAAAHQAVVDAEAKLAAAEKAAAEAKAEEKK